MWSLFRRDNSGAELVGDTVDTAVLAAATGIAWAFALELNITIFLTFRRRSGLYFWSLLACSWGLSVHAFAFILKFLVGSPWFVYLPFVEIGWVFMVTGQAFVLYSRLHLVVRREKTLRRVLWLIVFDALVLHVPTIVLTIGSSNPDASGMWQNAFNIMERIQLTGFCCQEFIISGIYLWSVIRIFKTILHQNTRKVMVQLLVINALCIGMDIVLIGLEFSNRYVGEASLKPMIYAIKLKLEFVVLNQLVSLTLAGGNKAQLSAFPTSGNYASIGNNRHSFSNAVALESQRRGPTTGPVVQISAHNQQNNGSGWTKKFRRPQSSANQEDHVAGVPDSQTMRTQTTTTVTSEAIDYAPGSGSGSDSTAEYKLSRHAQPMARQ